MAARLTQEELAHAAGLSARGVSDLERGLSRRPRASTLHRIATALALTPAQRERLEVAARAGEGAVAGDVTGRPAPAPALSVFGGATPPWTSPLVGREAYVDRLVARLGSPGVRWVTLTGTGGVGKTSLALEVTRAGTAHWPDGVAFVSVEHVATADGVLPAITHRLGIRDAGDKSPLAALADAVAASRCLLVVDNLEHVIDSASSLVPLLDSCPGLRLLVTSRVPARVRPEHVVKVPPLPVPSLHDAPAAVAGSASVELLVSRARMRDDTWHPADDELPVLATICRMLGGVPLAIELAAPRLAAFGPAGLLQRLSTGLLGMLGDGPRDAPQRHRTVSQTIEWSYDLLTPAARTLLRRAAVFADGFTVEALESVCADPQGADVLDAIEELLDHHLLRRMAGVPGALAMLQTVREFAAARLAPTGEAPTYRRRHAAYYAGLVAGASAGILNSDTAWMGLFDRENDNVLAAVETALATGEINQALHLVGEASEYWYECGHLELGVHLLMAAVNASPPGIPRLRAFAAFQAGHLARELGRWTQARESFELARHLYAAEHDDLWVAYCLSGLGGVAWTQQELDRAVEDFSAAVAIADRLGLEERRVAWASNLVHALVLVDVERALVLAEDCVRRCGGTSVKLQANVHDAHGLALARLGRHAEATQAFRRAGRLAISGVDQGGSTVRYLDHLAVSLTALGRDAEAARVFGAAAAEWSRKGIAPTPLDREHHSVRDALLRDGDEDVDRAWQAGFLLTVSDLGALFA